MAWSDLANNQMVSFTDAQSGGFPLNSGQSHVTSNQCMTKNDALTKYNLNASLLSGYTNNQLIPKSSWATGTVTPILTPSRIAVGQSSGLPSANQNATLTNAPIGTIVKFKIDSHVGAIAGCSLYSEIRVNGTLIYTTPTYSTQYGSYIDNYNWTSTIGSPSITVNITTKFTGTGNSANAGLELTP